MRSCSRSLATKMDVFHILIPTLTVELPRTSMYDLKGAACARSHTQECYLNLHVGSDFAVISGGCCTHLIRASQRIRDLADCVSCSWTVVPIGAVEVD